MRPHFLFRICSTVLLLATPATLAQDDPNIDQTVLVTKVDPSIKIAMKGRAGNLELKSTNRFGEGLAVTDYQQGEGFVEYNRASQTLTWRTKIPYTLNRLAKSIKKKAPYMRLDLPKGAELDFDLKIKSLGYGTLDFTNLNVSHFNLDVNYGDVDVSFPTVNNSIVRDEARFHLMAGDLEVYNLANLNAAKVRINGGVGELTVDMGDKLLRDTRIKLDMDIGTLELIVPKGTRLMVRGTSRDLTPFGLQKSGKVWEPTSYSNSSPLLEVKAKGPMGNLIITWK